MEFQKISSPSLRDLFIEQLEHLILSGKLRVGRETSAGTPACWNDAGQPCGCQQRDQWAGEERIPHRKTPQWNLCSRFPQKRDSGYIDCDHELQRRTHAWSGDSFHLRSPHCAWYTCCTARYRHDQLSKNIQRLLEFVNQIRDAQDVTTAIEAAYEFQHEFALISGNTLIPLIFQSFRAPIFNMWEHYCELYGIEELYRSNYKTWTYIRDRDTQGAIAWVQESMQDCIDGKHQIYYSNEFV